MGVGPRRRGGRGHVTPKFRKKYFSAKCHKIREFSGKYHVKFDHFVNFSYIYFRAKMSCPQSWLSSYAYECSPIWQVLDFFTDLSTGIDRTFEAERLTIRTYFPSFSTSSILMSFRAALQTDHWHSLNCKRIIISILLSSSHTYYRLPEIDFALGLEAPGGLTSGSAMPV